MIQVDFMDGSDVLNVTQSSIYSSTFGWTVEHVYLTNASFTVQVSASNEHYNTSAVALAVPVIIQVAVPAIAVSASATDVIMPPGNVTFTATLSDDVVPTAASCTWVFDEATTVTYGNAFATEITDLREFTYSRWHVRTPVSVTVTCFNLVSSETSSVIVDVYEEIQGLAASPLPPAVAPNETFEVA